MAELILALNAGSSSLKCALFERSGGGTAEVGRMTAQICGAGADADPASFVQSLVTKE